MSRRIRLRKTKSAPVKTVSAKESNGNKSSSKLFAGGPKQALKSIRLWTGVLLVAGIVVLGAGVYVWYQNIFTNPDRIFYGMLEKSLATDSISRNVTSNDQGRVESQNYFLTFTPNPLVQSESVVEQVNQNREKSSVTTETLGTKEADFVRYTNISVPPNSEDKTDYSKVTNIWAKRGANPESGQSSQFLNEAIFTFVPFGNFGPANRAELMKIIDEQDVYKLSDDGRVIYDNARPIYETTVSIKPRGLVEVLKKYSELTGIGDTAALNPEQYDDKYSFAIKVKIDMLSRHLTEIAYPGESRTEQYQSYGLNRNIDIPDTAISIEELQSKIQ